MDRETRQGLDRIEKKLDALLKVRDSKSMMAQQKSQVMEYVRYMQERCSDTRDGPTAEQVNAEFGMSRPASGGVDVLRSGR